MTDDNQVLQPSLTQDQIDERHAFMREYEKDLDAYSACIRIGYKTQYAQRQAAIFGNCAYVQKCMTILRQQEAALPEEEQKRIHQQRLKYALFREANNHGEGASHASRVKALEMLAKIEGM